MTFGDLDVSRAVQNATAPGSVVAALDVMPEQNGGIRVEAGSGCSRPTGRWTTRGSCFATREEREINLNSVSSRYLEMACFEPSTNGRI